MRTRVQPSVAALHNLDIQLASLKVCLVDGGDFQFPTGTGFDGFGNVDDLIVVKIQAGHRVVAFGMQWFFFNAAGFA